MHLTLILPDPSIHSLFSQIIQIYGALMAFIATRSGLTRWIEFQNKHHERYKLMNLNE
jgi:hypothetical protein